jgi:hypothetical protein
MALRTSGLDRRRVWLGQVGLRLGAPPPVPAPQPVTVYPGEKKEDPEVQNLVLHGARLTIEIGVPDSVIDYYKNRGQKAPQRIRATALIDSGASISGVKPSVAQRAGLSQTRSVGVSGVIGTEMRPVYTASVILPDYDIHLDAMDLAGVELEQQGVDVLLGRDTMRHFTLVYEGRSGTFNLQS